VTGDLLLAIDCGTGSARAVLFDVEGAVVASGQREWTHHEEPGVPGSQVFDTAGNWSLVAACVREALSRAGTGAAARVAAVSATSMREGMVLYDAGGHELWACPNVDARAGVEAAELVAEGAADEIYDLAGDWVAITAPARLRWLVRHEPALLDAAAHLVMLGDWVVQRLCGEFVTDPSLGSSSGMFDLEQRAFSPRLAEVVGVDPGLLPRVVEAGTVAGGVTEAAAAATGLRPGTLVVVGGADTQLGLLGAGIGRPGSVALVGGSFWQLTALTDVPVIDPQRRLRTLCHAVADRWMIEGIGFWCGLTMRWFRDAFCAAETDAARREGGDVYALLEERAADVPPGCDGLLAVFSNLMDAKRWVHAAPAFVGFDVVAPERSGTAACFRALQESAAYVARGHLDIVDEVAGLTPERIVFTGGAAKGVLWPQIVADVLGREVAVPRIKESSALGAAICAGVGADLLTWTDAATLPGATIERTVGPDARRTAVYDDAYERWRTVYAQALALTATGAVRPLWRAAGT
jgi:autoinducer 2 (AI-2) kinase